MIGCRVRAKRMHGERSRCGILTRSLAGGLRTRWDLTRMIGIGSQPGQSTISANPVHARSRLHYPPNLRMRQPVLGPVVDEPGAIEPAQSVGGAKPEKTPRISEDTADAIVGESVGSVVDAEGGALGL